MKISMPQFQISNSPINQLMKGHISIAGQDKSVQANNIIQNKLSSALGMPAEDQDKPSIFDYEAVANNVLKFVQGVISKEKNNGADDDKLKSMLLAARSGIKTGFAEASEVLNKSGLMSDDIKQGIDEAGKLIKQGLATFERSLFNNELQTKVQNENVQQTYKEASRYRLTENAAFSFTTQEGDQVNIRFNSDYLERQAMIVKESENSLETIHDQSTSLSMAFSMEVNGDLNEDEKKAINNLMSSLQDVSSLFFEGNIEGALDEALDISMNSKQLAAFSMDLQRSETMTSIKKYQKMMPGKDVSELVQPLNQLLKNSYEQAQPLNVTDHLPDLLQWINSSESEASVQKLTEYADAFYTLLAEQDQTKEVSKVKS